MPIDSATSKYVFCLAILVVVAPLAKNLVRVRLAASGWPSATWTGRRRDWHPPHVRQAQRLCRQLLHRRHGRCVGAFVHLGAWEPAAFSVKCRSACCSW